MNVQEKEIKALMECYKQFAVYGLSDNTEKPSHYVPLYMRDNGWNPVGAYPRNHSVNDFKIYSSMAEIPADQRKFVNVFRASDKIPQVIDELLELGSVEVIWLQLGISHPEAEKKAEEAGIKVVSDRCLIIEHRKWFNS